MTTVPLPTVESGPETLFRISAIGYDGHTVTASMPTGRWLAGPDGAVAGGSVGVLVDNVLGYAIIGARPPDHWSVSAEITLDLLEQLPLDGTLHAAATVEHVDRLGGYATARITDDDGRLLALGSQRGRFVAAPGVGSGAVPFDTVAGSENVVPWLVRTFVGAGPFVVPDLLTNPMGNVHGGISLCLSDLVARSVVADHLTTASVHIVYPRGVPAGSTLSYAAEVKHPGRSLGVVEVTGSVDGRPATIAQVVLHPTGS